MAVAMPPESDIARIRFKLKLLAQQRPSSVPCDQYMRDLEILLDLVDIAREQRDQAGNRAREAVQAEMAALRARINDAELAILRGLPESELWFIPMGMPTLYERLKAIWEQGKKR